MPNPPKKEVNQLGEYAKTLDKGSGYSGTLPSQSTVDAGINGAPKVEAGKQGKHVPRHVNNVSTKSMA